MNTSNLFSLSTLFPLVYSCKNTYVPKCHYFTTKFRGACKCKSELTKVDYQVPFGIYRSKSSHLVQFDFENKLKETDDLELVCKYPVINGNLHCRRCCKYMTYESIRSLCLNNNSIVCRYCGKEFNILDLYLPLNGMPLLVPNDFIYTNNLIVSNTSFLSRGLFTKEYFNLLSSRINQKKNEIEDRQIISSLASSITNNGTVYMEYSEFLDKFDKQTKRLELSSSKHKLDELLKSEYNSVYLTKSSIDTSYFEDKTEKEQDQELQKYKFMFPSKYLDVLIPIYENVRRNRYLVSNFYENNSPETSKLFDFHLQKLARDALLSEHITSILERLIQTLRSQVDVDIDSHMNLFYTTFQEINAYGVVFGIDNVHYLFRKSISALARFINQHYAKNGEYVSISYNSLYLSISPLIYTENQHFHALTSKSIEKPIFHSFTFEQLRQLTARTVKVIMEQLNDKPICVYLESVNEDGTSNFCHVNVKTDDADSHELHFTSLIVKPKFKESLTDELKNLVEEVSDEEVRVNKRSTAPVYYWRAFMELVFKFTRLGKGYTLHEVFDMCMKVVEQLKNNQTLMFENIYCTPYCQITEYITFVQSILAKEGKFEDIKIMSPMTRIYYPKTSEILNAKFEVLDETNQAQIIEVEIV